jgi:hypothetical protein
VPFTLITGLLIATTLNAQSANPVFKNGDPPPASAMALSVPQARAAMRDAIKPPPGNAMTLSVPQARNMLRGHQEKIRRYDENLPASSHGEGVL